MMRGCFMIQQTSSGMFGLGNSQTRCVKSYSTAPINDVARLNPMRLARLIWINNRTVTLMLADGSETRFNVWTPCEIRVCRSYQQLHSASKSVQAYICHSASIALIEPYLYNASSLADLFFTKVLRTVNTI